MGTEQEKRESETGIGKREKMGFKTRVKARQRWSSGDMRRKTVPQTSGRDRKFSVICYVVVHCPYNSFSTTAI